jgi:hypothetical protein
MTRTCGGCSKATCKTYGAPKLHGGAFLDQIVVCPKCGWCGVVTEILDEPVETQMEMTL